MENASCLLICGNTALYLALICQLPYYDGDLPAMLLALGLGLVMLLLAARFRKLPIVRIGLAPLPFLSLLLLPPGPAWISFLPALLIMALFAALNRFDWDEWQTSRWMRPVLVVGTLLLLRFAMHIPPMKEGIVLCSIFFVLAIIGLRIQRMGDSGTSKTLLNVGGVAVPIAVGAGTGGLLWLILNHREHLRTLFYWLFYPLIWLARKLFAAEPKNEEVVEQYHELFGIAEEATPPPQDAIPTEETISFLKVPEINWPLVISVLLAIAAIVVIVIVFFRLLNLRQENGPDIEFIPEKQEQKRSKRRPRSPRAVNRVRDAYRSYLSLLSVRRGIPLAESDTSLQVQERAARLPGQELAEELRQIYLLARYAGKATPEDARRAETDVKKLREQLLSEERR